MRTHVYLVVINNYTNHNQYTQFRKEYTKWALMVQALHPQGPSYRKFELHVWFQRYHYVASKSDMKDGVIIHFVTILYGVMGNKKQTLFDLSSRGKVIVIHKIIPNTFLLACSYILYTYYRTGIRIAFHKTHSLSVRLGMRDTKLH